MSENAKNLQSILIRLPNWVGDGVMATPLLRSIRSGYPDAKITVVGKPGILSLLNGLPYFHDTIKIQGRGLGQVMALGKRLRKATYDLGLILPNSFSSALAFFLGGVKRRTGYALNGRTLLLHRSIRPQMRGLKRKPSAMTHYYLELAKFAGGADEGEVMELITEPQCEKEADVFFEEKGLAREPILIGLNPGASFGPSKLWTPEGFAHVADKIYHDYHGRSILLCGPGEEKIADAILEKARSPVIDTSRNVLPLNVLKSVISRLKGMVTTDSGPRHFATALRVPVVVVMGPTDPEYTATNLELNHVLRNPVHCSPCHKKVCDIDHRCMTGISGQDAVRALVKIAHLSRSKR